MPKPSNPTVDQLANKLYDLLYEGEPGEPGLSSVINRLKKMDYNGDNKIDGNDSEEWQEYNFDFAKIQQGVHAEARRMVAAFDTNHDGVLSSGERDALGKYVLTIAKNGMRPPQEEIYNSQQVIEWYGDMLMQGLPNSNGSRFSGR